MGFTGDYVQSFVCPHCDAKAPAYLKQMTFVPSGKIYFHVVACGNKDCEKGTTFVYEALVTTSSYVELKLIHQFPIKEGVTHESIPQEIADTYKQGTRCLSVQSAIGSVTCFRRTLQEICKDKEAQTTNLVDQIDEILPEYLREQAHEIRLWGNLGAHPDEIIRNVTKNDAIEIQDLLDSIFEALYIIPFKVQQRRDKRNQTA